MTSRKPTFYDMLGHELRGPLFPIMALTDLLLEEDLATADHAEIREQLSIIAKSAQELRRLIDDHIAIGLINDGNHPGKRIETTLETVLHRSKKKFEDRSIVLDYKCDPSARLTVDAEALELLGTCLLGFGSDESDGEITMSVQREAENVVLQLRGGPMSDDERCALFEPFWRREDASAPRNRANGLRLALAARMAQQCGGETSATSVEGATLVQITLPAG